jgi:tetratricopeptide (TPR) repeat protein
MARSLNLLVVIYVEDNSHEKASRYFSRLSELYDQTKDKEDVDIYSWYLGSKAYMMKSSTRMRDRVEAQKLFKELIDIASGDFLISCLSNLCDLLLEELSINNDPEIMDEIIPLITKSLYIAESLHNYGWLAETRLLQAKLALILMKIKEAKKFLIQAQNIAELNGLKVLASKISNEHDKLLKQVVVWDRVKREKAPMAERIELASFDGVIDRLQGKRPVEPPMLIEEEPILLLIMDNSGATYFSHPFIANWDHNDLFSSFMSAFNTFMDEIFSKSIDRVRVGDNTILINPLESFLVCYVIKGQSYPALQKLTQFSKAIRENSEIWASIK